MRLIYRTTSWLEAMRARFPYGVERKYTFVDQDFCHNERVILQAGTFVYLLAISSARKVEEWEAGEGLEPYRLQTYEIIKK